MKTRHVLILAMALVIGLTAFTVGQSTVTWEGILPGISSELGGTYAINIANTASTVGLDVSEETALTNTVNGTIKSTHTTSGTPANGIGNGLWVYQESSASNTEKILELNGVITDATAGSEDAKLSIELMAGGAASAEVASISSEGDFTTAGWLILPSTTVAATPYTISATNKASAIILDYTDTGAASIMLPVTPADGTIISISDGDMNASSNNITVGGGAATINEAATFVQNADGESTTFLYDSGGTDWQIIGGYLE